MNNKDASYYSAWNVVTVGVACLDQALALWEDQFGLEVVSIREGHDPELSRLWGLQSDDIQRQALVRTGTSTQGMLHFVQFNMPEDPVRRNVENFDLLPKNLDVFVEDLPSLVSTMQDAGFVFRTETYSEFTSAEGNQFREIQLPAHDDINVVMVEVIGKELPFSTKGVCGIGPVVITVDDVERESAFYQSNLLLDKLNDNIFEGPEIEKMIGLPKGTALKIFIWGRAGFELGEIEIVEYQGVQSSNLYSRASPKALGILHIAYVVPDFAPLRSRLAENQVEVIEHGVIETIVGRGEVISFRSPVGFRIEVCQTM